MATVSDRAKQVANEIDYDAQIGNSSLPHVEQALLAERRLAMEEAAKIAHTMSEEWTDRVKTDEHTRGMADGADFVALALRAAAEKEVGK